MHSSILEPINTYIRSRQCQFTELLRQIITIPSPTGQEREKAAWVLAYLQSLGQGQAYVDEAGNVLCPCQIEGQTAFPLYSAHMDTVFEGLTDLTPRIDGNILAAPSCGDNSAGVAGLLFLIAMIRDLDLSLPQGALFAFNVGEEGMGNLKGMRRIMADWKVRITEVVAVDCTFDDVVREIDKKIIRRHPHVFGDKTAANAEDVLKIWQDVKKEEKKERAIGGVFDGIPPKLSGLRYAYDIVKKAPAGLEEKTDSNIDFNSEKALSIGKKLYDTVKEAVANKIEPEAALRDYLAQLRKNA